MIQPAPAPLCPQGRFHAMIGGGPCARTLAAMAGCPVLDLGLRHAGPDALLQADLRLAAKAETVVLVLSPLRNLSNAFYLVHPRRNDRFVAPTPLITSLFPEVDFTGIHFTHHLVRTLAATCEERLAEVTADVRRRWREAMGEVAHRLPQAVLLHLDDPSERLGVEDAAGLGCPVVTLPVSGTAPAQIARALLPHLAQRAP
ncbi:DUF6473 family protein [Falsirhodobacter xinxiangensis]|uniref:DUF6473 family protein n=1 Tax=Falsirhodobacter xinxiangensis TaxID=2530049 RepID=UPI0010A9A9F6|nr:DUF6473 family protein [Rhodobacter xinxiangensis]